MKALFLFLLISASCFAGDSLEVAGKRYELKLQEIPCVNGTSDLFYPAARITHDEMFRAGCNINARFDSSVDCLKIDEKILLRNFINSQLRNKNYCNCSQGPTECVNFCSKFLTIDECIGLCSGNCSLPYPRK